MAEYDENGDHFPEYLSLSKAEQTGHKSRHTIWRWRRDGMPTVVEVDGQRHVLLSDLQACIRRGIWNQKPFRYCRLTGFTPTPEEPVGAHNSGDACRRRGTCWAEGFADQLEVAGHARLPGP